MHRAQKMSLTDLFMDLFTQTIYFFKVQMLNFVFQAEILPSHNVGGEAYVRSN